MSTTTCLSVILTTVPVTTRLFGGQRLGGVLLGGLLAVEALECLGKIIGVILGFIGGRGRHAPRLPGLGLISCDSSDCSAVASGARVSSSVVRGLLSVGLDTSDVIDALLRTQVSFHACVTRLQVKSGIQKGRADFRPLQPRQGRDEKTYSCCTWIHTQWLIERIYPSRRQSQRSAARISRGMGVRRAAPVAGFAYPHPGDIYLCAHGRDAARYTPAHGTTVDAVAL